MQRKLYTLTLLLLTVALQVMAAPPTTPASSLTHNSLDGGSMRLSWTNGNGARRIVIARMGSAVTADPSNGTDYLASDIFGQGQEVSAGQFVIYDGSATNVDIRGLQPATTYHFKVFEYNGTNSTTEYLLTAPSISVTTLAAPTVQASGITFSNVTGNTIKVSWANGNGSKRLVVMRQGSAVNANPADLTSYTANTTFTNGTEIGTGNHVVHFGSANNVTVTGLSPNTAYHVAVYEANGNSTPVYLTSGAPVASQATLPRPSVAASAIVFTQIDGGTMRLNWTAGNGSRRIVIARAGSAVDAIPVDGVDYVPNNVTPSAFNTAPEISPGQKVVYDNVSTQLDISGLAAGTTYHFKVYEYDGTGSGIAYLTTSPATGSQATLSAPVTQASNMTFTNVTGNTMTVGWTNGSGARRLVLAKAGAPVDATPADLGNYSGNSTFGNGTEVGTGNYVVHFGTGNSVNVTNLVINQTYHFAVFEANGSGTPVFLTASPLTGSKATSDRPTVAASNMTFSQVDGAQMRLNWNSGNGQKRIIIARQDAPVDAVPVDGVDYLTGTTASMPFNTAPEIAPGQKVIYDNTGGHSDVTGLVSGHTYHFRVFEYSGTGNGIAYLTSSFASGSQATLVAPTTQASNIVFSAVTANAMTLNWTSGNGSRRVVIAKAGSPVDAAPTIYVSPSSSATFGNGAHLGNGNYVVFNNTSSTLTLASLTVNTTYHFAIYEANGASNPVYNLVSPAVASQTTGVRPTTAPVLHSFSQVEGNKMRINFNIGNGERRIVVMRAGAPVDAVPADGVDYLAGTSASFTGAPEISDGQKVVYDNAGSFADVTGLQPGITYHIRIYEYSGTGASIGYLTSSFAAGSQATVGKPTVQTSNITFTSVAATSLTIGWTNGNGAYRMVVVRQGSPVSSNPVDLTSYAGSTAFGSGNQVGSGNYVIVRGANTSTTVTNLQAGTTYHVAVYEFNGFDAPMYLTPALTGQVTTVGPPAVQAANAAISHVAGTSATLTWTNGSGNRRMVLVKAGSPVDAVPVNKNGAAGIYFANSFFGSGSQIGTGNYVVFDGIQDFVTITNLQPGTVYHFAVFEYNDFGSTSQILTTSPAAGTFTTGLLPVKLTEFKATSQPGKVVLQWSTAQEQNSAFFEVQRSTDGIRYEVVGNVQAAGNSSSAKHYSFTDAGPGNGQRYYRLRQVDVDSRFEFSRVVRVSVSGSMLIRQMTNPVSTSLFIELGSQPSANTDLQIISIGGQVLKTVRVTSAQSTVDVSSLPSGTYIMQLRSAAGSETRKFIKQ